MTRKVRDCNRCTETMCSFIDGSFNSRSVTPVPEPDMTHECVVK